MGAKPHKSTEPAHSSIAIIGMACEFPGAHSPEELWQNVLAGRRYFRKAPKERVPPEYFDADPGAPGQFHGGQMAVIEGWQFDPQEFRVPPITFHASDMAQWLALATARAAIRDAGLDLQAIDRTRMGVVLGATSTGGFARSQVLRLRWPYAERVFRRVLAQSGFDQAQTEHLVRAIRESYHAPLPELADGSLPAHRSNTIAGRICDYFDLGAAGYTVDGACSSSLLSLTHACNALLNHEMDFALAGGVDLNLDPFEIVGIGKAQAPARDDLRPYDERASGMLLGEGCGLFVLMREADARAAGRPIHALVRGWGVSADGTGGMTAPGVEGQMRALTDTYARAGYPLSSVSLIEGHGAGTGLGDEVEITAIRRLLQNAEANTVCRIGSLKGSIGHCKAAAGAASLIKMVMALKRKVLPPTVNCDRPNAAFGKPLVRLRPCLRGRIWNSARPRRASVNSMGLGGANAHVTLEEANPEDTALPEDLRLLGSGQTSELILLSSPTLHELKERAEKLIPVAERLCRAELTDLGAALAKSATPDDFRLAIVAESPWHLADSLRAFSQRLAQSGEIAVAEDAGSGIFAGQAANKPMLVALFPGQGSQRLNMGEHLIRRYPFVRELYEQADANLSECMFRDLVAADEATLHQWEASLCNTRMAEPAIALSSVAMLRWLEFCGLRPELSIGHSLGEISALHAAGAYDAATAVRLAGLRGQAMSSLAFRSALGPIEFRETSARVLSTSTGEEISPETDLKALLARQIRQPVRFLEAVQKAAALRPALWIEVGPGGVLTNLVSDILGANAVDCMPTDLPGGDGFHQLNRVLARAFVRGFPVATERLFDHRFHRAFAVENYQPVFIANACERAEALATSVEPMTLALPAAMLPEAVSASDFADYLGKRASFLRDLIATDYRHATMKESFTIAASAGSPSKNRNVGQASRLPSAEGAPRDGGGAPGAGETPALRWSRAGSWPQRTSLLPIESLGEWVRTFRMARVPAPIGGESLHPLPSSGSVVIVSPGESSRTAALGAALRQKGLNPIVASANTLTREQPAPSDLAAIISLVPGTEKSLLESSAAELDQRIEGFASQLFGVFRWALAGRHERSPVLRGMVMRSASPKDPASDLDAGAAFLKSLQLENPNAEFKWVVLPERWTDQEWAETGLREMECSGSSSVWYSESGERTSAAAHPFTPGAPTASPILGPDDVVLVSSAGQGVAFPVAAELARQTRCKLALIGSSPRPGADADPIENELVCDLERLRQQGIVHAYFQADVTNLDEVRRAAADVARQLGNISGVVHGSGFTHSRMFRDTSLEEFLHCIRVQTRGLLNLLASVPTANLKVLHVFSSVFGSSGLRGKAGDTFANAWLDRAVTAVKTACPQIHCLFLGYTVWAETDLTRKIGAAESLRALGIKPITTKQGVAAYARLLERPHDGTHFMITGRLAADLERNLYRPAAPPRGRFLERVLRWIPGTEIVADASLSHTSDLYLGEHIIEGTPTFPAVMAIEAMVQAAMACAGSEDLPVLRNIILRHPLVVPIESTVAVRLLALAEESEGPLRCVRVALRSNPDDFQENHCEAECWFGLPVPESRSLPTCPLLPAPIDRCPEDFSPVPLFQGKFFQRITGIRKITPGEECLTDLVVPDGERYWSQCHEQPCLTFSPALRDAFVQSIALALPTDGLPERIAELRFYAKPALATMVHCRVTCVPIRDGGYEAAYVVFDSTGTPLEQMTGLIVQMPKCPRKTSPRAVAASIPPSRVASDLDELLPAFPHGLVILHHHEVQQPESLLELTRTEINGVLAEADAARRMTSLARLVATRRAAAAFAQRHRDTALIPTQVSVAHLNNGKPELRCEDAALECLLSGVHLALAECHAATVAVVGHGPLGVAWEAIESRSAEDWRGLLGDDGYSLALATASETEESFDGAAARVWTLLEAGRKVFAPTRVLPSFGETLGESYLSFNTVCDGQSYQWISVLLRPHRPADPLAILTVLHRNLQTKA